jgi:hypothetical protein
MPKRTAGQYELILLLHLFQNDKNLIFDHIITSNRTLFYSYHTKDNNLYK